jgi:putative transposase
LWQINPIEFGSLTLPIFGRSKDGFTFQALDQALGHGKPEAGTIFHSDRGNHYAGHDFREILKRYQFSQSMSATGNCYDNA